jgi:hypothetical protein
MTRAEEDRIRRIIFEKFRRRLAEEFMMQKGNTDKFDRVLALWIDLQRAIHLRDLLPAPPHQRAHGRIE